MISFACLQCGRRLAVKEEFAGRSTKCPGCKKPLVVPDPSQTAAFDPPRGAIDGSQSTLGQAGMRPLVALPVAKSQGTANVAAAQPVSSIMAGAPGPGPADTPKSRFVLHEEIARGGMGAVLRGTDCDIHREVAIKYMLDDRDPRKKARFVEEAQITGQLEHPNIVPIHELGVDAKKRLFFAMKMVRGRSLAEVLEEVRDATGAVEEWSLGRLLNVLVNACHALAYAHSPA